MNLSPEQIVRTLTEEVTIQDDPMVFLYQQQIRQRVQVIEGEQRTFNNTVHWRQARAEWLALQLQLNGRLKGGARSVIKPDAKGSTEARILHALDVRLRNRTAPDFAISTAELDAALKNAGFPFVASTSTKLSKLRAWYRAEGIGKLKRVESREGKTRICRYYLERVKG